MQHCWICGDPATTAEHKIKKSDLERVHGRGRAFAAANLNYRRSDDSVVVLQGPDSKWIKWPNVLCAPCNNHRSQPFDRAYEEFVAYADSNRTELLSRRQLDFSAVYGDAWDDKQRNLFKYFAKALGCKIADAGKPVPKDLAELLFQEQFQTALWVCVATNEDELQKWSCPLFADTYALDETRSPRCPDRGRRIRRSSGNRWSSWWPRGAARRSWHASSSAANRAFTRG